MFVLRLTLFLQFRDLDLKRIPKPLENDTLENDRCTFVLRLIHFHRFHNLDFDNVNISNKNKAKMVRILKSVV